MDKPGNVAGLITAADKFTTMMTRSIRLQELSTGHAADRRRLDKLNLAESAINHMIDNYIVVPKHRVLGLSGFVCKTCMTFQLEYIRIIGIDITAEALHKRCRRTAISEASKLRDKSSRLSYLYSESASIMESLIRSIFPGKLFLKASRLKEGAAGTFQAPDITHEKMGSTHWGWSVIKTGKVDITKSDLKPFLKDMMGSYALFTIPSNGYNDYYVIYISPIEN
jgi:hypothetical protein